MWWWKLMGRVCGSGFAVLEAKGGVGSKVDVHESVRFVPTLKHTVHL